MGALQSALMSDGKLDGRAVERLDDLHDKVTEVAGTVKTIAKLAGDDHDTITGMAVTMEQLTAASTTTATGITVLATLGETAEKRRAEKQVQEQEQAGRRWRWFEENYQKIAFILLLLGGVQADNIAAYFGVSIPTTIATPIATPTATVPAPAPVAPAVLPK